MNLADDLRWSARRYPEKSALIFGDQQVTYADLDRTADRVAAGLHKIGVRKGDRVASVIPNRPSFAVVYYGTLRAGAVAVPLHPRLRAADLRPPLVAVTPRAIIAGESVANEVMSAGPHSEPVFVIGKHPTARPFEDILPDAPPPTVEIGPRDLAVIAHTSGITGRPKPVKLTHANLAASLDQLSEVPGAKVEPNDVVLGALPLSNVYGLNVVLTLSMRYGATILLEEKFDAQGTLRSVATHRATVIVGTPPMFEAWLQLSNAGEFDLSSVRFAVSGGSGLRAEVIEKFRAKFGIEIWEGYGLTEAASAVTTTRMSEQRAGSIGKVLPGQELRLVDRTGEEVLLGDPGEIWIRGPNVFSGYWGDDDASAQAFSGDWFMTGDIAYRDEDDYLWLVDPENEVVEVSGFKVYPKEVENALREHPAVAGAAAVGVADPRQGQKVKAFVVLQDGKFASEQDLVVHCTKHLARFKVPAAIEFVDELPRLESGLVMKRLLRRTRGS